MKQTLKYITGIIFIGNALGDLIRLLIPAALFFALAGIVCLPPTLKMIEEKLGKTFESQQKYFFVIVCLFIGGIFRADFEKKRDTSISKPTEYNSQSSSSSRSVYDKTTTEVDIPKSEPKQQKMFNSVSEFTTAYNLSCEQQKLGFKIEKIKFHTKTKGMFEVAITPLIRIWSIADKEDDSISGLSLIAQGDGSSQSGQDVIVAILSVISVADPSLSDKQKFSILDALDLLPKEGHNLYNLSNSYINNRIRYRIVSSEVTGFLFSVEKI